MKNIRIIAVLVILLMMITTACSMTQPELLPSPTSSGESPLPQSDFAKENQALSALLPKEKGFEWRYFGFAEYGHQMTLDSITKGDAGTTYAISGMIDDMSDGEAEGDFTMAITYEIAEGKLLQRTTSSMAMDSEIKSLILVQGPLEKGTTWTQKVVNKDNVEMELNCTIKDVTEDGGRTYVMRYEQKNGDYYEERTIREGWGIVSFTRLFVSGSDKFDIGFSIYDEMSGYKGERELKMLLPPSQSNLRYFGLAEYAHAAKLDKTIYESDRTLYEVTGSFEDGSGIPGSFKVHYIRDRNNFTVTEKVLENTRSGVKKINSIIPDLVILKSPIKPGTSWQQQVTIDGKSYTMNAVISDGQTAQDNPASIIYTIKYSVEGVPGYFNNTYLEERKFQTGKGMLSFQQLMPGDIGLSGKDLDDPKKVEEAIINHSFGYGLDVTDL